MHLRSLLPVKFGHLFFFFFSVLELSLTDGSKSKWQEEPAGTCFFNLFP